MSDMTCIELVDVITEYLDGDMPPDGRARFEHHLAGCPFCTDYVAQMRGTIARMGTLAADQLSPATQAGLLDAFRGWHG
jgi:anti-sigma factor RsiW